MVSALLVAVPAALVTDMTPVPPIPTMRVMEVPDWVPIVAATPPIVAEVMPVRLVPVTVTVDPV